MIVSHNNSYIDTCTGYLFNLAYTATYFQLRLSGIDLEGELCTYSEQLSVADLEIREG